MKSVLRICLPMLLLSAVIGCQPAKRPAAAPAPIPQESQNQLGQPETVPPENMQNEEPAPMPEPAPERHASRSTPHLGSLPATYNAKADTLTVVVPGKILFALGSTKIKSSAHAELDRIAFAIRREYPGHRVYVDGHTDSSPIKSGRWANNHVLAFDRAMAVAEYMMKHGIHENQMVIRSYGSINPKRTAEASRRVEIVVVVR